MAPRHCSAIYQLIMSPVSAGLFWVRCFFVQKVIRCTSHQLTSWRERKGAIRSWEYLKSLHSRERFGATLRLRSAHFSLCFNVFLERWIYAKPSVFWSTLGGRSQFPFRHPWKDMDQDRSPLTPLRPMANEGKTKKPTHPTVDG